MADSKGGTASTASTSSKKAEEPKLALPAGHPQAGYVGPDLSLRDGVGLNDEEQAGLDKQIKEREEQVAAVAEHEHEVATAEHEAALAET